MTDDHNAEYTIEWYLTKDQFGQYAADPIGEYAWGADNDNPTCPRCGRLGVYAEGQIAEDERGNAIDGCWWDCHHCHLTTDVIEFEEE